MPRKKTSFPSAPFTVGDTPTDLHVANARVCDERDIMAAITSGGIEIQVMAIGVTNDIRGMEKVVYMRLENPITIPFGVFRWEGSSDQL